MMICIMMTSLKGLPNKYCCQISKDVRLDKGDQYFNEINENGERNRYWRKTPAHSSTQITKDENEGDQTDDNDVPCNHVCKKSYH